jgi:hypothetical protein
MSATTNLAIPYITAAQNQKEVTHSTGMALIDAAITETLAVSVSSGNATPTAAQVRGAARIAITGATTSGRTVTLPVLKRPLFVSLDASSTKSVSIVRGSSIVTILPGASLYLYTDGTANGLVQMGEFGLYRAALWVRGVPSNSEILTRFQVKDRPLVLLPDLLGWSVVADVAATASTVWSVRRNGSAVATLTWAISGTLPTLATTGNAAQTFAVDDYFDVIAATSADATLADVSATIVLVRS